MEPQSPPPAPSFEPTPDVIPTTPAPKEPEPKATPMPATLSTTHHEFPAKALTYGLVIIALLVLSTVGAFLYIQNMGLRNQLMTLQNIQLQRQLPETTPTATESAISPTPSSLVQGGAFAQLSKVLPIARSESATAQLLMVTADLAIPVGRLLSQVDQGSFQYWFREGAGIKRYFQVILETDQNPRVQPATISPDNDIPDLIASYEAQTLGIDTFAANQIAWEEVVGPLAGTNIPTAINAKYTRAIPSGSTQTAPVNLWQMTYQFDPASGLTSFVVQIDAQTMTVIYTNAPTPSPTQASTGSPS